MKLQKDTLTRHGIDKTSRRLLETIFRRYPESIEIGELSKIHLILSVFNPNPIRYCEKMCAPKAHEFVWVTLGAAVGKPRSSRR